MKTFFSVLLIMGMLVCAGCKKDTGNMTVIMDCSGSYLRFDDKDYKVCNVEKLAGYSNNQPVNAQFDRINSCTGDTGIVCMLFHQTEGIVRVTEIKPR